MSVSFVGLEKVLKRLDKIKDPASVKSAMGNACAMVERSAKTNAPKDTGALRRSIESKVEGDSKQVIGTVYTPLEYAPYVEYGTGLFAENGGRQDVPWCYQDDNGEWHTTYGQDPQPYMRPALDENEKEILRLLQEALLK